MSGTLFLCATPIGNLEDMTLRVLRVLQEVDLIAAEDTRNSIKLLNHFEIRTPMTSYHDHNRYEKAEVLIEKLRGGADIALITDAGMPGISDPGEELVRRCREEQIPVTALPGASAVVTAAALSGLSSRRFVFEAFLPAEKKERAAVLASLGDETRTIILYEAPHRLEKTLAELEKVFGADRRISLCKELTKKHERVVLTTIGNARSALAEEPARGEYVLVIEGCDRKQLLEAETADWKKLAITEHMQLYEAEGMEQKEAMKQVARDRGMTKREVYQALLKVKTGGNQDETV